MNKQQLLSLFNTFFLYVKRQDRYVIVSTALTLLSVLLLLTFFLITYRSLPGKIPLFYSRPWGQPELVIKLQFLLLPSILTLVALTNYGLATQLHPTQNLLKRILLVSVIFINLILTVTAFKITSIFV